MSTKKNKKLQSIEILSIFRDSSMQAVLGVSLFVVGALLGVLIAQRQSLLQGPLAPNVPPSQPKAAGNLEVCELVFDIVNTPTSTPSASPTPTPTAMPTPTPEIVCTNCNYQIDAYWGPVIKNFNDGDRRYRYHGSGPNGSDRLLRSRSSRSISTGYDSCELGDPSPNDGPTSVASFPCGNTDPLTYLSADIDTSRVHADNGGYATATFTNDSSDCAVEIGLASYRADDDLSSPENIDTQEYITHVSATIQPGGKIELSVPMSMLEENELTCVDEPSPSGLDSGSAAAVASANNQEDQGEGQGFGGFNTALEFLRSFFNN